MGRQTALPQEVGDLLKGHLLRQVGDDVALVDEAPVGSVHHRALRLRRDDALEARDVRAAHLLASWRGLVAGCGPVHTEAGRMIRRSESDSSTCAVQPATREVAKRQLNNSFGIPAPGRTAEGQKSTLVAVCRSR